jgi:cytochrome c oxidase cbb3-type subunit 3
VVPVLVLLTLAGVSGPIGAQPPGNPRRGEMLYREKCTLCHGAQGQGWDMAKKVERPPVPVPDLAQVVPDRSDRYLFDVVRDGGEAVGRTRFMPPFGFQLSDQEVWDVVAYLRTLRPR